MSNSSSSWPIPSQTPVYSESPCGLCQVITTPSPVPCSPPGQPVQIQQQDNPNLVTMPRDYLYASGFIVLIIILIQIFINNSLYAKNKRQRRLLNTPTQSTLNTIRQV